MENWAEVWHQLEQAGWRIEMGPRGDNNMQTYYLPPDITRGPGAKNRVDYFDSRAQVLRLLKSEEATAAASSGASKRWRDHGDAS
eukprot:CAMPEP_0177533962 /NCGR_PEP_ID=MMETSP0369-20130122/55641_1 /TAXON_ID=447022 ORGANISM="Scrippsiella hangoei-like, Strain SHHI-4" /NCGR_SAMPLE_ID=MMETSP0369 /ASSEMBLY_ACC=CAM_ASM_000364 /LENGTH=84 /DNA_ID=CAMNT_0019015777 /DNA_START=1 /DNA_END=251 /DNA_ORIENTATION=-